MVNKWRKISYDSDGCDIYQCLKCKNIFTSRTGCYSQCDPYGFKYCGFCGILWESEHNLGYNDLKYFDFKDGYDRILPLWLIQKRTLIRRDNGVWEPLILDSYTSIKRTEWEDKHFVRGNFQTVKFYLNYERGDLEKMDSLGFKIEYRALVVDDKVLESQRYASCYHNHTNNRFDFRYYKEYQDKWGGKMHNPQQERRWYLPK